MSDVDNSAGATVSEFVAAAKSGMRADGRLDRDAVLCTWAESGAMALTGSANGQPRPEPAPVVIRIEAAARALAMVTERFGHPVEVDGPALLGERAAFTNMGKRGVTSVGEAAQMVEVADGWVALNLARPEDTASLPALVSRRTDPDNWPEVAAALKTMTGAEVLNQGRLLGMALAVVGEHHRGSGPVTDGPAKTTAVGPGAPRCGAALVVDLTALWAGPLATGLLAQAGAQVVKVESPGRPDGARQGPKGFFDLLNSGKEQVKIDFATSLGRAELRSLIESADLVVSSSRPRVWGPLGIDPATLVRDHGTCWLAITAHGPEDPDRIGFGDDAAVAGGLVIDATADSPPLFVADAVADPVTGLVAALYGAVQLTSSDSSLVELSLRDGADWVRRSIEDIEAPVAHLYRGPVAAPRSRTWK